MQKDLKEEMDRFFRDAGRELEAAMRDSGTALPEGLTGETFARAMMSEAERRARSPEGKAVSAKVRQIVEQVVAELPGGLENPLFEERVRARMHEAFEKGDEGSSASA
jgi:hypothetical protein